MHTVAHPNHFFTSFKFNQGLDVWFVAYLLGGVIQAVLAPDYTGDLAFSIADKSRLGFDYLQEEFQLALGKDFNPSLIARLQKKLVTLAPEREHKLRIVEKAVLTDKFIECLWIDLSFYVGNSLSVGYKCAPVFRGEKNNQQRKDTAEQKKVAEPFHNRLPKAELIARDDSIAEFRERNAEM